VVDTGFGVSAEAQARLFLPFQTVHDDPTYVTQKWGGTGLGLSICKIIGELLGGTVGVVSAKDAGSVFWLRLRAEWWADTTDGSSAELGTVATAGLDQEEVLALSSAASVVRRRRGSGSRAGSAEDSAAPQQQPPSGPRRYSLDAWTLQARRALGASPVPRRTSVDAARTSEPGSLAEQLAAVAEAHTSSDGGGALDGTAAVSSALLATLRTLRQAVGEAEVAVASRLKDPAGSGRPSMDNAWRNSSDADTPFRSSFLAPTAPPAAVLEAASSPEASSSSPPGSAGGPTALAWPGALRSVLLVDDEPVNTRLVARRLERVVPGVSVTVADDGQGLVDLCIEQRLRYDIVLLDQHMRGMNGDAAVAALRAHEAACAQPRALVLACTGNSSVQDVERFEHAGFDGVITKPLDLNALVPALAALVADRAATPNGVTMFDPPHEAAPAA
jgi:CheY-like chemotaxis protein